MFARGLFAGIVGVVVALGAWAFAAGPDAVYRLFATTFSMPESCKVAVGTGKMECRVKVEVKTAGCPQTAADINIDPDPLKLNGDRKTILVWQFTGTNKFYFCPVRGDGIYFKPGTNTKNQFDKNFATDDRDGGYPYGTSDCYEYYRWRDMNDSNTHGDDFAYKLVFGPNDPTKPACSWDPFIRNG
ncbi:MAG TPA: hypothetical protein VII68_15545 [Casimicrobiaceae bacterium]|jgi:hypothetical protein